MVYFSPLDTSMTCWPPRNRSRISVYLLIAIVVGVLYPSTAAAQIAGRNINMVSGTQWPGGDPFLQRQNEPSIAVSSRNPQHLLAGANDYRTVDLPYPDVSCDDYTACSANQKCAEPW